MAQVGVGVHKLGAKFFTKWRLAVLEIGKKRNIMLNFLKGT